MTPHHAWGRGVQERLAPLSDPRKLIPDDQAMGQRIGLGTTPAGPALVWEVDIDNVGDFSSSLQVRSRPHGPAPVLAGVPLLAQAHTCVPGTRFWNVWRNMHAGLSCLHSLP